jgi:hypothetical protein
MSARWQGPGDDWQGLPLWLGLLIISAATVVTWRAVAMLYAVTAGASQ